MTAPTTARTAAGDRTRVPGFGDALRSELRRLAGLRSTLVYAVLMIGAIAGPPLVRMLFIDNDQAVGLKGWTDVLAIYMVIAVIFAASGAASEFAQHRIAFVRMTRQHPWVGHLALVAAHVIVVALSGVIGMGLSIAMGFASGRLKFEDFGDVFTQLGSMVCLAAAAAGFGMLVRNQVAAIGVPLVWLLVIESIFSAIPNETLNRIWEFMPGAAVDRLSLAPAGWIAIAAWTIGLLVIGLVVASRRDLR
ncbi:hypothetical protein [Corynebacterium sp. 335C]